jgi:hypothetical protein
MRVKWLRDAVNLTQVQIKNWTLENKELTSKYTNKIASILKRQYAKYNNQNKRRQKELLEVLFKLSYNYFWGAIQYHKESKNSLLCHVFNAKELEANMFYFMYYSIDIFDKKPLDKNNIVCHSGGAIGSDTYWENIGEEFGVKTNAYSWKTSYHQSKNKVEISESDYKEGIEEVNKANKWLNRYGIHKYMNLLARNWSQVKYSEQVIAIGTIVKVGEKNPKGYYNKGKYDMVDGGTGYAVQMAINNGREV